MSEPKQYTHRPISIDAIQITQENFLELGVMFCGAVTKDNKIDQHSYINIQGDGQFCDVVRAYIGQWIILSGSDKTPLKERYYEAIVLDNNIFQKQYILNPTRVNNYE